jgi:threonyl-tRNA synthetase
MDINTTRHSLSHVLALATKRIYGDKIKFGTGPATENGFFYDIEFTQSLSKDDFSKIQAEMEKIIKENIPFRKKALTLKKSQAFFKKEQQPYKLHLLKALAEEGVKSVTHYQLGEFEDLCTGPHLKKTGEIKIGSFTLTKIAGAYWQGNEENPMLTRISGLAFVDRKALKKYLIQQEEAKERDHKKIGRELDLFSFHEEAPGSAYWHPRGMIIWNELEKFGKEIRKEYGYQEIQTPQLAKNKLWITSGHWDHYQDSMFVFDVDKETYCLKPMDCPFNIQIYQTRSRSYREFPIRYTEIGRVMRNEKSGELNGLFRVRSITQDDAHIFLKEDQVEGEIVILIKMIKKYFSAFGIKPVFFLSTRPDEFMGEIKTWDKAETNLKNALKKEKARYELKEKDGAFYGPKIDLDIEDSLGRKWQLATLQLDFQLPQRFHLEYADKDGKNKIPVIVHAAIFGSLERFIGILTEHLAGNFPLWLSPVQVKIISVGKAHAKFCEKLAKEFTDNNIRTEVDNDNETVGKKIREALTEKVPYVIVVGDKEIKSGKLAVRDRKTGKTELIAKKKFVEEVKKKIQNRS